jgi:nucleotide-binding universal stress UspA family protein
VHPKKILHPTDYSQSSRPALAEAVSLARDHQAGLVLLHVVDSLGPEQLTFQESVSADQPAAYRQRLFDELRHVLPADLHAHVDYVLSEEDPLTAILRTQAELGCDLIVLGTHGTTGLRHWFTGSLAEEVVRRAPCPVLVVKAEHPPDRLPPLRPTPLHPGRLTQTDD